MATLISQRSLDSKLAKARAEIKTKKTRKKIACGEALYLTVMETGNTSWQVKYREGGKAQTRTIGPYPLITLAEARDKADDFKRERIGLPPVAPPEPEPVAGDTVKDLFEDWLGKHPGSAVYHGNIRAAFVRDVLVPIGAKRTSDVSRAEIVQILRAIEARGSHDMRGRVRMWLKQMFEYGAEHEGYSVVATPVPTGRMLSFQAHQGGHFPALTDPADALELMRKIEGYQGTVTRAYLHLAAHLWQRPSELRESTWREFDLDGKRWTIPAERTKGEKEHWVPLSAVVVDLLRAWQGVVGRDPDGYLFPGRGGAEKTISEGTAEQALQRLGYQGRHCPHGFRAMARTILEEKFKLVDKHLEMQLSHADPGDALKGAYNRAKYWDERVAIMDTWSGFLVSAYQPAPGSKP